MAKVAAAEWQWGQTTKGRVLLHGPAGGFHCSGHDDITMRTSRVHRCNQVTVASADDACRPPSAPFSYMSGNLRAPLTPAPLRLPLESRENGKVIRYSIRYACYYLGIVDSCSNSIRGRR
jgi:hypothetical protein